MELKVSFALTRTQILQRIADLERELVENKPPCVTSEDIENVSDNYQANLEYGWYEDEVKAEIDALKKQLR